MIKEIQTRYQEQSIDDAQNMTSGDHFVPLNPDALASLQEMDVQDFAALKDMSDMDLLGRDIARPRNIIYLREVGNDATNTLNEVLWRIKVNNQLFRYHWCRIGFTAQLVQR